LPAHRPRLRWELLLDTREPVGRGAKQIRRGGEVFEMEGRSLALFRLQGANEGGNGEQAAARPKRKRKSPQQ
jgi:hypothetical protein